METTANRICANVLETVGSTPLVYLNRVTADCGARIAVKLEYFNPAASIKDRPALGMLERAEREGRITPGKSVIIEGTSGNTGIALAMAAAVKGYRIILVMPDNYSIERRALLRAFGADVVLTNHADGHDGLMARLDALAAHIPNSFVPDQVRREALSALVVETHLQLSNPANPGAHYASTGPEIWAQTQGAVDIVCFGVGTGGTTTGVGRYLRERKPSVQVYAVEPFESSVINGYPKGEHYIFGTGAGIIPDNLKPGFDAALRVRSADAVVMAKRLAREEGLLAGVSGGANVCAAIELANRPENANKLIVTCLCDWGERYLSSVLYRGIWTEASAMAERTLDQDLLVLRKSLNLTDSTPSEAN